MASGFATAINQKLEFFDCDGQALRARRVSAAAAGRAAGADPALRARRIEPNQWKGDLFNPENGKIYIRHDHIGQPDALTLTGCLIAFLCQSEGWTKVPVETRRLRRRRRRRGDELTIRNLTIRRSAHRFAEPRDGRRFRRRP